MTEARKTGAGYYVAAMLLIALLVAAVALVAAMMLRPGAEPANAIVVTDRAPVPCPTAQKDTTCFESQVTNTGGSDGLFTCHPDASGDTTVTFADGTSFKQISVGPDESVHVTSAVTANGTTPASAPRMLCTSG
jgi:hypothetical protein